MKQTICKTTPRINTTKAKMAIPSATYGKPNEKTRAITINSNMKKAMKGAPQFSLE